MLEAIAERVTSAKHVNRWLVLLVDIFISAIATIMIFWIVGYILDAYTFIKVGFKAAGISVLAALVAFLLFGTHKEILRYTTSREIGVLVLAVLLKTVLELTALIFTKGQLGLGKEIINAKLGLVELMNFCATLSGLVFFRLFLVHLYAYSLAILGGGGRRKVLVFGDDDESVSCVQYLENGSDKAYTVAGMIRFADSSTHHKVLGKKIYDIYNYDYLKTVFEKKNIDAIVFPSEKSAKSQRENLIPFALKNHLKLFVVHNSSDVDDNGKLKTPIREVKIEDLLGREEVVVDMDAIRSFLKDKSIMVTGAAGSIGSELCRLICGFDVKELLLVDNAETPLHNIKLELEDKYSANDKVSFFICDVRNKSRLEEAFIKWRPDIIFHAAAYKHVPMMEMNPTEAIRVNVLGTMNVANLAVKYGVDKMIEISTDKAVNPTNVMGASKRIAEIYTQSLSRAIINGQLEGKTKFITTRFGNVLGSNGSVIPTFRRQIAEGGPVTVTHRDIVRYFMSIPEACRLVLEAATLGDGYEIFVFDMGKPVKIADLAENMIRLSGLVPGEDIKIEYTGLRPGEKLFEEILNDKENTLPTKNNKIFIAKVREFPYDEVIKETEELMEAANSLDDLLTVKKMKEMVPEYKSKNSIYEQLDIISEGARKPVEEQE